MAAIAKVEEDHRYRVLLAALGFLVFAAWYEISVVFSSLRSLTESGRAKAPQGPRLAGAASRRLEEAVSRLARNVIVYPASAPFFGYGISVRNWNFVIDAATPVSGCEAIPFAVSDLLAKMRERLTELDGLCPLGVILEDRVMVSGTDVNRVPKYVRDRVIDSRTGAVAPAIDSEFVDRLWADPDEYVRPYMTCSVVGWGGNLVLTAFIRVRYCNGQLSIEVNYSVLTPIDERYRSVDAFDAPRNIRHRVLVALTSATLLPGQILMSPIWTCVDFIRASRFAGHSRLGSQDGKDFWFNYGSGFSLREQAINFDYQKFFQRLDSDLYAKAVEQKLLEAIKTFLADHNVDASAFESQSATVINHGVFVTGDATLSAQSIAAGANARSTMLSTKAKPDRRNPA
ncbi:hypothetical protein [Actinoplanes sp. NPDC089786]|uniref:hypothetical protein n=1 Tax=Actinoplanes sp. NPDC089786 TaxID=3155185 RepID=UPI003431D455